MQAAKVFGGTAEEISLTLRIRHRCHLNACRRAKLLAPMGISFVVHF